MKNILSYAQFRFLKHLFYSTLHGSNLRKLALAYGTDKEGQHFYAKHYQDHFSHLRLRKLNLLEIGIGGYEHPDGGGASLRMWKAYFPKANIVGIDIFDKSFHDDKRIKTHIGSQTDPVFLKNLVTKISAFDIIIDDGSHVSNDVIASFKILFPLLATGGIYVIEDLQTSYWEETASQEDVGPYVFPHLTSMNFLKTLVDGLNYEEFASDDYSPTYFDKNITSIHFYHNLVFIYKGDNREGSNILGSRF